MVSICGEGPWPQGMSSEIGIPDAMQMTHQNADVAEQALCWFIYNVADLVLEVLRSDCSEGHLQFVDVLLRSRLA